MDIQAFPQQTTMTTTTTTTMNIQNIPPQKYRRLDMAQLPPFRLERIPSANLKTTVPDWDYSSRIKFKNVWDDEAEAKRIEDEEKADLARAQSRTTQTKSTKMRRRFCKFCQQRGFPLAVCKTHYTKSGPEFGEKITCPALLQQQCARCGEIGHTPKYCKSKHWLKTDPCQIVAYRNCLSMDWFNLGMIECDDNLWRWQKPIPPALQTRHDEYEERCVKSSRIWIEMTGDHKHYTNDFRIVMMVRTKDDWFDVRERTEYEARVQEHYEWMRTVMWDETRQTNRDHFFIVNSQPPSYEEAIAAAAAEFVAEREDEAAGWVDRDVDETERRKMRDIIHRYMDHHHHQRK